MLKILNSLECPKCKAKLNKDNIKKGFLKPEKYGIKLSAFYGGRAKVLQKLECKCGAKYVGFMKVTPHGFDAFDMAECIDDDTLEKEKDICDITKAELIYLNRRELLKVAAYHNIEGKIVTMRTVDLINEISKKL